MNTATESKNVTIPRPKIKTAEIKIKGTAPLVIHKFSSKARNQIIATQEAGSVAKGKKKREAKDFDEVFEGAKHISEEGWCGISAPAFRNAMVSACRLVGFQMTKAKLSIFVVADGLDVDDGTPLVKIESLNEPEKHTMHARNDNGSIDIRCRPMWREWGATLKVQWDADQFTLDDVVSLVMRAGMQVGVGEGRPDSKNSCGMGWGLFSVVEDAR